MEAPLKPKIQHEKVTEEGEILRRCQTCKEYLPVQSFPNWKKIKRCRPCCNTARKQTYYRNKMRRYLDPYLIKAPVGHPCFEDMSRENMKRMIEALQLWGEHKGAIDVIIPVDRHPKTGYPSMEMLRLTRNLQGNGAWEIDLDGLRARFVFAAKPIWVLGSMYAEKYAVLEAPILATEMDKKKGK